MFLSFDELLEISFINIINLKGCLICIHYIFQNMKMSAVNS